MRFFLSDLSLLTIHVIHITTSSPDLTAVCRNPSSATAGMRAHVGRVSIAVFRQTKSAIKKKKNKF